MKTTPGCAVVTVLVYTQVISQLKSAMELSNDLKLKHDELKGELEKHTADLKRLEEAFDAAKNASQALQ